MMANEIQLYGVIDPDMSDGLREQLNDIPTSEALTVKLASPGGLAGEGVKMYNWLRRYKSVEVMCEGDVFSAATLISCAGDHVSMADNALMMVHEPYVGIVGNAKELKKTAAALEKLQRNVVKIYHAKTRVAEGMLASMMAEETYLEAEDAMARGFVDSISGSDHGQMMFKKEQYDVHDQDKLQRMLAARPGFARCDQSAVRAKLRGVLQCQS